MLKTLRNLLFGRGKPARERRRLAPPGPCPRMGASIVKRNILMKVSEPITDEFWQWLVLEGWREVRLSRNRRKYTTAPSGVFIRLANVEPQKREGLYRQMLGSISRNT